MNYGKTQQSPVFWGLWLWKTRARAAKSNDYRQVIDFKIRSFSAQENAKPAFSNSPAMKSVFKKLRFRERLVWMAGLTVEIKLRFSHFPDVGEQGWHMQW